MNSVDRSIRAILVVIAAALLYTHSISGWPAVIVGFVGFGLLISVITAFCPLYAVLRIGTARRMSKPAA